MGKAKRGRPRPSQPIGWMTGRGTARILVWGADATGLYMSSHVMLGDSIAKMSQWAHALEVKQTIVADRLRRGWTALDALDGEPRWEHDPRAQRFVAEHPSGARLETIGEHFGLTRERIRQIQATALGKVRATLKREQFDAAAWLYEAQQRAHTWDGMLVDSADRSAASPAAAAIVSETVSDGAPWTVTEVSRATGINRTTVGVCMRRMCAQGELDSVRVGRVRRYQRAQGEEAA